MDGIKPLLILLVAAAGAIAPARSATAQCRLCDQPTSARADGSEDDGIQLQIETDLEFDRLVISGGGAGAATMRPDGSTGAEGSVGAVGPRARVGTVLVHGQPNRLVRVDIPRRIELHSAGGGRMVLEDVTTDLSGAPRLDAAGNLSFRFGGRLTLSGDADGQYRGDLPITVEYQ